MTHPVPELEVAERNHHVALAVYAGKIRSGKACDLSRCAAEQAAVVLAKAKRIAARHNAVVIGMTADWEWNNGGEQ